MYSGTTKVNKTVSIALATYNGARFLREQLDSVYSQTYKVFEVVATDDGSTDSTLEILEEYHQSRGLRFAVNARRLGFLKNFERSISLCEGDFIALSDQDDIWRPQKIEILLKNTGDQPLVCSDVKIIDAEGVTIADSYRKSLHIPVPPIGEQFCSLAFINFVTGSTCLFPSAFREKILPIPAEAISHDWWIGIKATLRGGIRYIDDQLVFHRQHGANAIGVKELWKLSGKWRYLRSDERKQIFAKERTRIQYYLDHEVFSDEEQREFLQDLLLHYEDILSSRVHFDAARFLLRNRVRLFYGIGPTAKCGYLLGRLL
jgi:glycosyltransferase involved in cell wall biosynthesis